MPPKPRGTDRTLLQSVQRASQVLLTIARERRPLTVREAAERLGINVATCHHLVNTLEDEGLLRRDSSRRVWLGHRIGELHDALEDMLSPDPTLVEFLDLLSTETRETCYLGVWDEDAAVSAAVREGNGGVFVRGVHLGYRDHTYARALGRALLAFHSDAYIDAYLARTRFDQLTGHTCVDPHKLRETLAQVRQHGYAIEREEFTLGVCCAAVPVIDRHGTPIAAFSISVPKARFDRDEESLVAALLGVAQKTRAALNLTRSKR